jgi:hypothetical protein
LDEKQMMELIRSGKTQEFIFYFPHYATIFERMTLEYEELCDKLQAAYDDTKEIKEKSVFATSVQQYNFSFVLINAWIRKCGNIREFLALLTEKEFDTTLHKLEKIIGKKVN